MSAATQEQLVSCVRALVADVPDFPRAGVMFKDLTPIFADPPAFAAVIDWFAGIARDAAVEVVAGIEARGFLLGAPVAVALGVPFVPIREAGKLPRAVLEETYNLEYGSATLAIHADTLAPGARVLLVDDVLATGGTAAAAALLVSRAGGITVALGVLLELGFLGGRARLPALALHALLTE